jgi:hypothetical protein
MTYAARYPAAEWTTGPTRAPRRRSALHTVPAVISFVPSYIAAPGTTTHAASSEETDRGETSVARGTAGGAAVGSTEARRGVGSRLAGGGEDEGDEPTGAASAEVRTASAGSRSKRAERSLTGIDPPAAGAERPSRVDRTSPTDTTACDWCHGDQQAYHRRPAQRYCCPRRITVSPRPR